MYFTYGYVCLIPLLQARPSSDMAAFREEFAKAKHIVALTGAGVSAESGVPTFRGAGGFWRTWQAQVSNHTDEQSHRPAISHLNYVRFYNVTQGREIFSKLQSSEISLPAR